MKVAVTDANIFIDLINLKLVSHFFDLDIEIHSSLEVLDELYPQQQEILIAYKKAKRLTIHVLDADELERRQLPGPYHDRSVFWRRKRSAKNRMLVFGLPIFL
jgi:hypothetical protein